MVRIAAIAPGDDREVGAADAAAEHRHADDQALQRGTRMMAMVEGEAVERLPERRQRGDLVPVHEVRNAGRGLDLGVLAAAGSSSLRNIAMQ